MSRCGIAILFLGMLVASATPAEAQWFSNFWANMKRDYHRNVDWPNQFVGPDRDAVNMPFALMVANGVRRQNLLSDYHFNEETNQLNLAGETKVRHILTQSPPTRRTLYVQRALTAEVTAARMETVQHAAVKIVGDRALPQVVESDLPNDGSPADEINDVAKRFQSTRPDPRLTNASSGGGGSGGGGGGGSGSGGSP